MKTHMYTYKKIIIFVIIILFNSSCVKETNSKLVFGEVGHPKLLFAKEGIEELQLRKETTHAFLGVI